MSSRLPCISLGRLRAWACDRIQWQSVFHRFPLSHTNFAQRPPRPFRLVPIHAANKLVNDPCSAGASLLFRTAPNSSKQWCISVVELAWTLEDPVESHCRQWRFVTNETARAMLHKRRHDAATISSVDKFNRSSPQIYEVQRPGGSWELARQNFFLTSHDGVHSTTPVIGRQQPATTLQVEARSPQ